MYDLAIIGGGPAGLSAALYAGRAGLSCIIFEKLFFGGQMLKTSEIDNYPGSPGIRDVYAFSEAMRSQAAEFGAEFKTEEAVKLYEDNGIKTIVTAKGKYYAKALILATGSFPKKLDVPGEHEFTAKGVSYCAVCDGAFFKNKTTAVIGGGDTALEDALFLSAICKTVYVVHRRDAFRGSVHLYKQAKNCDNIRFVLNSVVCEIIGDRAVNGLSLKNVNTDVEALIDVSGVFVAIGSTPDSSMFKDFVKLDKYGYVITDINLQTSVPGVFAAGDVRQKSLRQIITAASDGAEAVYSAQKYILEQ